MSHRH